MMSAKEAVTVTATVTLFIPLVFSLFMIVDRAWSFYLLMQLLSNVYLYSIVSIPQSCEFIIVLMQKVSNFKLLEEPMVRSYVK